MDHLSNARILLEITPTAMLAESGARAAAEAIRQAKASGLSIHYIEDGLLIEEAPDGTRKALKALDRPAFPEV